MFTSIYVLVAGIPLGFLLRKSKRAVIWTDKLLTLSVWILLFLLGIGLGVDKNLMAEIKNLGLQAFCITFFAVLGSLIFAYIVAKCWYKEALNGQNHSVSSKNDSEIAVSKWTAIKSSCIVLCFFLSGICLGYLHVLPAEISSGFYALWTLYILLFLAGMSVGFDLHAFKIIQEMKGTILIIPIATVAGTVLGSMLASLLVPDLALLDAVAVGVGLGYYSLSSTIISQEVSPALGSVALLSNIMREVACLVFTPVMLRFFGLLGPLFAGGATSNDSSLPIIAKFCGESYAIIAIFTGVVLTLAVPFLVPFVLYLRSL